MDPLTFYTIGIIYRQKESAPFDSDSQQPGRLSRLSSRLLTVIRRKVETSSYDRQAHIPLIECYGEQE